MASLKDKLKKKREELKKKSEKGSFLFLKEGTVRVRHLPAGEEEEFAVEVIQFYLGNEIKGVISAATFGEPCKIMETYEELKASDDDDDKELAKSMSIRRRYISVVVKYEDSKGKKLEPEVKLLILTNSLYEEVINLYLDADEWGDMTDEKSGYDIKYTRSGTGQFDTEYSCNPCKNSKLSKKFTGKIYDPVEMIKKEIPTYEDSESLVNQFFKVDEEPKKKKKKKKKSKS